MSVTTLSANHFIGGGEVAAGGGETAPVLDPITGEQIAEMAVGTPADVDAAVAAAAEAAPAWRAMAPGERARAMRAVAAALRPLVDEYARIEAANTGKTFAKAHEEISGAPEMFDFYAGVTTQMFGKQVPMPSARILCYTVREPIGVVGAITPWNYPLLIAVGKLAGALAAGCTIVMKPAPETPITTAMFARLAFEAGLPAGVINVVTGDDETGAALASHPGVAKVTFTGSTAAGRAVAVAAGRLGHGVVMELGGKSPNIIFDDVDLEAAIEPILMAGLVNGGQECCAGARILAHDSIVGELEQRAAEWLDEARFGRFEEGDEDRVISPVISERHRERVAGLVDRAIADGAKVIARREVPQTGFFYPPTILSTIGGANLEICRTEIFGPVLTIDTFADEDEAIAKGNDTEYGLAAGVWTTDLGRAVRCAERLHAGNVWINSYLAGDAAAPFGGFGDSGFGREIGVEGALEFTAIKTVYIQDAPG